MVAVSPLHHRLLVAVSSLHHTFTGCGVQTFGCRVESAYSFSIYCMFCLDPSLPTVSLLHHTLSGCCVEISCCLQFFQCATHLLRTAWRSVTGCSFTLAGSSVEISYWLQFHLCNTGMLVTVWRSIVWLQFHLCNTGMLVAMWRSITGCSFTFAIQACWQQCGDQLLTAVSPLQYRRAD